VLDPIGNQSGDELTLISFSATASDVDLGDALTFSLEAGATPGTTNYQRTGIFTWTPTETQGPGVYTVTVRVTDNGSPSLNDFETIQISVGEVNAAPVLDPIGNQSIAEGSQLTFIAAVSDSDIPTNALTFSARPRRLPARPSPPAVISPGHQLKHKGREFTPSPCASLTMAHLPWMTSKPSPSR
jgi:hypothetical protein